jgi:predicted transcriptional regulator
VKESLRRSHLEIFVDVLDVIKDKPLRLTHITLKAKLNFVTLQGFLSQLTQHNLIEERVVKTRKRENIFYAITKKGSKFLRVYRDLNLIFNLKQPIEQKISCKHALFYS